MLSKRTAGYRQFFLKSEEGQEFIKFVGGLITSAHEDAEKDPDHARDYTMKARAARDVLTHIQSVTTEVKRGKNIE